MNNYRYIKLKQNQPIIFFYGNNYIENDLEGFKNRKDPYV